MSPKPAKRGRPLSQESTNSQLNNRRAQARERVRLFRARRSAAQQIASNLSLSQVQQEELIISSTTNNKETIAPTARHLGIRVQDITIPQDPLDAQLQEQTIPINEHEELLRKLPRLLHTNRDNTVPTYLPASSSGFFKQFCSPSLTAQPQRAQSSTPELQGLSRYFQSLPPQPPFNPNYASSLSTVGNPSLALPCDTTNKQALVKFNIQELGQYEAEQAEAHAQEETVAGGLVNGSQGQRLGEESPACPSPPDLGPGLAGGLVNGSQGQGLREESPACPSPPDLGPGLAGGLVNGSQGQGLREESPACHSPVPTSPWLPQEPNTSNNEALGDEGQLAAQEHVVERLYEQLQLGFKGCTEEEHEEQRREHLARSGNEHYGLVDISNDRTFPSVLSLSEMISLERLRRQGMPTSQQWQDVFCGIAASPSEQHCPRPRQVCLHKEETQAIAPTLAFDIDSFLGFGSSLALARQGIWYQPAAQMRQNINADNHLQTYHFENERAALAMIRDVPHFLLGRVVGAHDITVHVLFPHIPVIGNKFRSLTHEQLSRWLDQVFHPAVYQLCESHVTQHLPGSYRVAYANSKAHQTENRQVETSSYQAQQSIGFHLQPEYLESMWDNMLQTIEETPGLADFREPQLFFSAKGTKLQFKTTPSRPTLLDALENFDSYINRVLDFDFVQLDRLYVDVGKEICSRTSRLPYQTGSIFDEAQVYMWKRCCLEKYMQWIYDGKPPGSGKGQRYYEQNMLYEACSLTSETPKRSTMRFGGLIYSQFYSSVKEVWDAAKCMPFGNEGIEELALDPGILKATQNAGSRRRDTKILEQAYLASKRRAHTALKDSRSKSFGIREEHRISWTLFQLLLERLRDEEPDGLEVLIDDCPSYAWAVKTEVYLDFLWRSADKFATGFEVMRARRNVNLVSWEETKMMVLFLRCLQYVLGGHGLQQESALWWSRRERTIAETGKVRIWVGLGFCNTLHRYGYAWIEPRFDWAHLQFDPMITDHVLFGNAILRKHYLRRGRSIEAVFDQSRKIDLAMLWLEKYRARRHVRERMLEWLIHICLQQFRQDILVAIKHELRADHQEDALQGKKGFSYEYFVEIMAEEVHLVSGNRCDFKNPDWLRSLLWDYNDGRTRKHWENKSYRKLYQRTIVGLSNREDGKDLAKQFKQRLLKDVFNYHRILPYPTSEVLTQTTKQGTRMWYSIIENDKESHCHGERQWKWGRKAWEQGRPPGCPEWADWSKEEWEKWLPRIANEQRETTR